jgi:hypothetical protein
LANRFSGIGDDMFRNVFKIIDTDYQNNIIMSKFQYNQLLDLKENSDKLMNTNRAKDIVFNNINI